ncbi:DegT/DnrJ/EryC1/StrS family aminotransferase [Edaphocola flava]|uniref:DegT/DnrJ/EryC1/StrS family aminotransferase n=1 Tax=Edaphocola flava TaxID=2499629 RepID=UPI001F270148|nr:DegT/DnrJ/EryC1/StrS family aminotransferase [Edaphocola flava]
MTPVKPAAAIQMVDLKGQYLHIKTAVDAAIQEVIDSTAFIKGRAVQDFAGELASYTGAAHVVPCANGTDALQIALMALDLQPGDEVITPSFTYFATAEVIALLGLKPVFVDVDPDTFNISIEAVARAITARTRAIVPVHLFGQSADMESLLQLAQQHNIAIIEDNAQALGGSYTFADGRTVHTGTMGHMASTSFFPSKNLGCYGDGGALFTNDEALFTAMNMIANHGQQKKYHHERIGCNSRLDTIQAAILRVKLPQLDQYCAARIAVAEQYNTAFAENPNIKTPYKDPKVTHVYHQYTMQLAGHINRAQLQARLKEAGIPSMIYYPVPCHMQEAMKPFVPAGLQLPVSEQLSRTVLSLPIHTEMEEEMIQYISTMVNQYTQS